MSEEYPKIEIQQIEAALTPRQKDGSNNAEVIPRDKDVFVRYIFWHVITLHVQQALEASKLHLI